jgi:hypothetical protein
MRGELVNEAVRVTLIFSAILIAGGMFGCVLGVIKGESPSIAFGAVGVTCGIILATLSVLAHRKTRP